MSGSNELRRQVTRLAPRPTQPKFLPLRSGSYASSAMTPTPHSRPEMVNQLAVACLGAGVVTTVAVAQGQNPLTALAITLFSALVAVMVGQVL